MLILKKPEITEKRLVLGDYVMIHVPGWKTSQAQNTGSSDMRALREELFQRIQNEVEVSIDLRYRGAA
jgi:hypothetical protein